MEHLSKLSVSVIVPVYNDAERLKICLEALENQTYLKNLYEVIVVDNASDKSENIPGVVTQFGQAFVTFESIPGSYAARNKGIAVAKGDVIAFTDADCIPAQDWIAQGVSYLLSVSNCGLVAGKIEIFFKNSNCPTPVELYEKITAFPQEKLLEEYKGGATANVFTFKTVINKVGLFNANLKSHGDLEWGQRVFAQGYSQIYADALCVAHPARFSLAQLYQRTIRLVAGNYEWQCQKVASDFKKQQVFVISLAKNLLPPLRFVISTFQDLRLSGFKQKIQVSLVMFFVRYVSAWEIIKLKFGGVSARI